MTISLETLESYHLAQWPEVVGLRLLEVKGVARSSVIVREITTRQAAYFSEVSLHYRSTTSLIRTWSTVQPERSGTHDRWSLSWTAPDDATLFEWRAFTPISTQPAGQFATSFLFESDEQLLTRLNREVGNQGWGTARAAYLRALHEELDARPLDLTPVSNLEHFPGTRPFRLDDAVVRYLDDVR